MLMLEKEFTQTRVIPKGIALQKGYQAPDTTAAK